MRVMAKFSSNPQQFPYDTQQPYLEFASRAYGDDQLEPELSGRRRAYMWA